MTLNGPFSLNECRTWDASVFAEGSRHRLRVGPTQFFGDDARQNAKKVAAILNSGDYVLVRKSDEPSGGG